MKLKKVRVYELQLLSFVENKYPDIMKEIEDKKIISPELEKENEGYADRI